MTPERFELSMLGGAVESRYRKMRPDVERLPWGTLPALPPRVREAASRSWTIGALLEHRAAAAAAATVRELVLARAPLDLVCTATRFPLDELVHAEISARMAMELGAAADLRYQPAELVPDPPASLSSIERAALLVVQWFCVAESFSLPLVKAQRDAATHPLARGVFELIVRDDSRHARFGWDFLDWALDERPALRAEESIARLSAIATDSAALCVVDLDPLAGPMGDEGLEALGLIDAGSYARCARRSLHRRVIAPLRARGIRCDVPAGWEM